MTAIGIDLGGTKVETQIFDADWQLTDSQRIDTPHNYDHLVAAIAAQIAWADTQTDGTLPIGIGAAGLINPTTGHALTANLPATNKPLPSDIATATGRPITYINDCRALALSEAVFGAGRGHHTVMSLILGTGVGGGIAINGKLPIGPTQTGGEFGHTSASAPLIASHNLPIFPCGCGSMGCVETYISGPGLSRIAKALTGRTMAPPQIALERLHDAQIALVWQVWCQIAADLLRNLTLTVDPDIIVIGGGLSNIAGVIPDLSKASKNAQFHGFDIPTLVLAEGGEASGARGAAYAAWQVHHDR